MENTLFNSYNVSDLTVTVTSSAVYSGSGEADVIYREGIMLNSNLRGLTWCDDAVNGSAHRCDQQYVKFNRNMITDQTAACHETGHAVGLVHGVLTSPSLSNADPQLGCMRLGSSNGRSLGSLQIANLNHVY